MHFADMLNQRITKLQSRLVIGIDPHQELLLKDQSRFKSVFAGKSDEFLLSAFCSIIIDVAENRACAVKPQAAFFESMGIMGYTILGQCIRQARKRDIPVVLDAKRGDIGSTASAYAKAYLHPDSEFCADALTVNPYLGPDTLEPFITAADKYDAGLFVLVKTSNLKSGAFQNLKIYSQADTSIDTVSAKIGQSIHQLGSNNIGESGFSNIGAVVGATYPKDLKQMREIMPTSIFLVPGYGAQGGKADDVKTAFYSNGTGAIVSSSRGIIFAHEDRKYSDLELDETDIYRSMDDAAKIAQNDINKVIG